MKLIRSLPLSQSQSPRLNWHHLKQFYYMVQLGSLPRAAAALQTSQAKLSTALADLENHLGVVLLKQTSSGLVLTPAGQKVFDVATQAFGLLETVPQQLEDKHEQPFGLIRIKSDSSFLNLYLMDYLQGFMQEHPDIRLAIHTGSDISHVDLLEIDVVIRPRLDRVSLIQVPLMTLPIKLYASRSYLTNKGIPQTLEDLDHHRLMGWSQAFKPNGFEPLNWHLTEGTAPGQMRQPFVAMDSLEDHLQGASMEFGLTTLLAHPSHAEDHDLVEVLPDRPAPTLDYHYIYAPQQAHLKGIQLLQEYLKACCQQEESQDPLPALSKEPAHDE